MLCLAPGLLGLCAELTRHLTSPFRTSIANGWLGRGGEGRGSATSLPRGRLFAASFLTTAPAGASDRPTFLPTCLPTDRSTLPDGNRSTKTAVSRPSIPTSRPIPHDVNAFLVELFTQPPAQVFLLYRCESVYVFGRGLAVCKGAGFMLAFSEEFLAGRREKDKIGRARTSMRLYSDAIFLPA